MTALSIQPPFPLISDIDGQPLEDGYIWIGVANLPPIGNPIAVYWDAALTTPAALPVRTRGGYPVNAGTPARLYVGSDYSILVQNKNGSTLYSAPEATEAYGGGIINASVVVYDPAGLGAVPTTVQAKLRETVSVKDFGAVGDGVADDTAAFAAAVTAAASLGCAVYVPGTATYYRLLDEITVPDGVSIAGDGWFSRIRQETVQKNAFILGNNCTFDRLRISGDGIARDAANFTKENGVYASSKRNVSVRHCFVDGWQACGVQMANCFNYDISHNLFFNNYWSYPSGTTSASDILAYSSTDGARAVIIGNLCLSDNSQGIFYNSQGFDTDATIVGNVCVALNSSWNEVASGSLNRRHGIVVTYGGSSSGGRIAVTGNVCRNSLVTGIYVAMGVGGQVAVTVTGNVCSLNGFATVSDATLAGGISINGGQAGLVVANNAIHDFIGAVGADVGGITYNDQDIDANASAVIANNSINTSTACGVMLKGTPKNVDVRGNDIRGCVQEDIYLITTDATKLKNIRVDGNRCERLNATSPSIKLDTILSTQRFWVENNIVIGFNSGTVSYNNSGIYLRRTDVMGATVRNNKIKNFYAGIFGEQSISGRTIGRLRIDYNEIETAAEGIALRGAAASALVPCIGNRFTSVTTKFDGGGFDIAGLEVSAILDETRIHFESAASPTSRSFAVGDYAKNRAPVAGQPKGWYCTVAGTPGTWVSEGNL
jgi:hypothetical protein